MLVLTRRPGESAVLATPAGPVVVQVLSVQGRQVRLGIQAPRECRISRAGGPGEPAVPLPQAQPAATPEAPQ